MSGVRLSTTAGGHRRVVAATVAPRRTRSATSTATAAASSSALSRQGAVALTLRLLLVSLAMVALFIMIFNLSFAYTRLANHHYTLYHQHQQHRQYNNNNNDNNNNNNNDNNAHSILFFNNNNNNKHHLAHQHRYQLNSNNNNNSNGRRFRPSNWRLGGGGGAGGGVARNPLTTTTITTKQQQQQIQIQRIEQQKQQQVQQQQPPIPLPPPPLEQAVLDQEALSPQQQQQQSSCQVIASIHDMLHCYRTDLVQRLQQSLQRLPSHCVVRHQLVARNNNNNNNNNNNAAKFNKNNSNTTRTTDGENHVPMDTYLLHNWTQLQSCLTFVRRRQQRQQEPRQSTTANHEDNTKDDTIRTIHILGERHSGTKFVQQELQRCFPRSAQFRVHRDLQRSKHFFQSLEEENDDNDKAAEDYRHSLIIAVFRDPMDWTEAMRLKPYHAPFHMTGFVEDYQQQPPPPPKEKGPASHGDLVVQPLDWKTFVTRPWTMPREARYDLALAAANAASDNKNKNNATVSTQCHYGFGANEIIPCWYNPQSNLVPNQRLRGFAPLYEMTRPYLLDPTSKFRNSRNAPQSFSQSSSPPAPPFDNILQLRADKIRHLALEIPLLLPNLGGYLPLRYEDLLVSGMQHVVDWVAQSLNVPSQCQLSSSSFAQQQHQSKLKQPTGPQPDFLHHRQAQMPMEQKEWIQSHVFVPMEQLLGYFAESAADEDDEDNDRNAAGAFHPVVSIQQ